MQDGYFESKEFKDLLGKYETMLAGGANVLLDSEELTDIAEYYHWNGRTPEAISTADYALSMYEGASAPLVLKARIALLSENNPAKAEQLAEEIADKTNLDYFYIKAEILVATSRGNEADIYLETCQEQVDDNDYPDFVLDAAILFIDYEYTELAAKWLAKSDEPDLADYREVQGRIDYYNGEYEESEKIFNDLIDESPYSTYYWDMLASTQLAMSHLSDAITSSEYALAISPDDEDALLYKGQALMRLKNYEEAIEYLDHHAQVRPSNIDGLLNSAFCHIHLDHYQEGITHLKNAEARAKKYAPDRLTEIYQEEAFTYSHNGEPALALECLNKMEERKDCDPNECMVLRGHIHLENGQQEEAQKCYQTAVVNSMFSPSIMLRVAVSLYDNEYVEVAYNILSSMEAKDLDGLPQSYSYMAICAHDMGDREKFLEHLKEATTKSPTAARAVLSTLFPEEMDPASYYDYASNNKQD